MAIEKYNKSILKEDYQLSQKRDLFIIPQREQVSNKCTWLRRKMKTEIWNKNEEDKYIYT